MTSQDRKGLETRLDELQRKLAKLDKERADIERNISHVKRTLRGAALDQLAEQAQELGMGYEPSTSDCANRGTGRQKACSQSCGFCRVAENLANHTRTIYPLIVGGLPFSTYEEALAQQLSNRKAGNFTTGIHDSDGKNIGNCLLCGKEPRIVDIHSECDECVLPMLEAACR